MIRNLLAVLLFVLTMFPAESAQAQTTDPARDRLLAIYGRLAELGLPMGDGEIPESPLVVNGKPVFALFLGDWHRPDYQNRASKLIPRLAEEFGIKTLLLEGESSDPHSQLRASSMAKKFEDRARATVLSAELRKHFGIKEVVSQPGNYLKGNYRSVLAPELEFPRRAFGLESRNPEDLYYQMLRLFCMLGVQLMDEAVAEENGRFFITIDGHPISDTTAVFVAAHRELTFRYGAEFPKFPLELAGSNAEVDHQGRKLNALVLTSALHRERIRAYQSQLNKFFLNHDQRVRNFTHAHRIVEFFREQASSATPGEAENIVLVVVGTGHLFCNDKLPASHPSVPKILATLGVTAGSTFAVEPGEKVDCNINPVTGAVSAEIVKLEAEKK